MIKAKKYTMKMSLECSQAQEHSEQQNGSVLEKGQMGQQKGSTGVRTRGRCITSAALYHWAIEPLIA